MTGKLLSVMEAGPRLKKVYIYLDTCAEEIESCEYCSVREQCNRYCDTHLYSKNELLEAEFKKHLAAIMHRRQIRKRVDRAVSRVCEIEFFKAGHREINLVCGSR